MMEVFEHMPKMNTAKIRYAIKRQAAENVSKINGTEINGILVILMQKMKAELPKMWIKKCIK